MEPLLFLIFINDLPSQIQHSIVDIYADDATLSTSVDIATGLTFIIESQLQNATNQLVKRSDENSVILNASETQSMLVAGKRLPSQLTDCKLGIRVNGSLTNPHQETSRYYNTRPAYLRRSCRLFV